MPRTAKGASAYGMCYPRMHANFFSGFGIPVDRVNLLGSGDIVIAVNPKTAAALGYENIERWAVSIKYRLDRHFPRSGNPVNLRVIPVPIDTTLWIAVCVG